MQTLGSSSLTMGLHLSTELFKVPSKMWWLLQVRHSPWSWLAELCPASDWRFVQVSWLSVHPLKALLVAWLLFKVDFLLVDSARSVHETKWFQETCISPKVWIDADYEMLGIVITLFVRFFSLFIASDMLLVLCKW